MNVLARLRAKWRAAHAANADYDDCQPWFSWRIAVATFLALMFTGGAVMFGILSHAANQPSSTPVIEDHK